MDWQGIERLFQDEYTSALIDRQVHALDRVAAACSNGVLVSDLHGLYVVLTLAVRAVGERGAIFEAPCCSLLRVIGKVRYTCGLVQLNSFFYLPHPHSSQYTALSSPKSARRTRCN
jgi:hypothetical protein